MLRKEALITLLAYILQLVISSDSIPPNSPKSAPEAPTEMFDCMKRADKILPPNPEMRYSKPIRAEKQHNALDQDKLKS